MLRVPAFGVVLRGGWASLLVLPLAAALLAGGALSGHLESALVAAGALVTGWALGCVRVVRMTVLGPDGSGGPDGGTAGVREPRRPRPRPPAGAIALPVPIDPPDEMSAFA